jgi:aminomethyltransferase
MELTRIPLHEKHVALGAKMVSFGGFEMPVRYSSDVEEHLCVRQGVGIFDVSHMGEFLVTGPHALDLIQYVTSNDASQLSPGKVQYSCFPNDNGGIVDDLLVYKFDDEKYLLVVNASNIGKDWDWVKKHNTFGANMEDISKKTCLFAVQGPKAADALQSLTSVNLAAMTYYTFEVATFANVQEVIISATGYTGAGGFEIYVPNEHAKAVFDAIMGAGKNVGIKPIGLGARDTLRLEMGYNLYGNDIDDSTSPIEAGLGWITKFNKTFVNSENLKKQKEKGVAKKLVGFKMEERGIPRAHYPILDTAGNKIGEVTSGSISPLLNQGIGMGYVPAAYAKTGTEIGISIRDKSLKATVVKPPFIDKA